MLFMDTRVSMPEAGQERMPCRDRADAGRRLARRLRPYADRADVLVLALPRGGVPVAYEIARALGTPLDVLVVRKLGTPGQPELAMGAIASGGTRVVNHEVVRALRIDAQTLERVAQEETEELRRRERAYRGQRAFPALAGKTVILVDDGVATGSTLRAGLQALRLLAPARIVLAIPHGARASVESLAREADEVVCLAMPEPYFAVGQWYQVFDQTGDAEVRDLLRRAASPVSGET